MDEGGVINDVGGRDLAISISFRMVVVKDDGTEESIPSAYRATGGTMTGSVFVANGVPGRYRVIGTSRSSPDADTADIVVVPTTARHHTTTFSLDENPISEAGRWINGRVAGVDWANISTREGRAIGLQGGVLYSDATAVLTGAWGANQTATAGGVRQSVRARTVIRRSNCGCELSWSPTRIPDMRSRIGSGLGRRPT